MSERAERNILQALNIIEAIEQHPELSLRLTKIILSTLEGQPDLAASLISACQDLYPQSVLSGAKIKEGMSEGWIQVDPFREDRLNTSSYDVSLGEYYYTNRRPHPGKNLFNPHNPDHVNDLWQGPRRARTIREILSDPEYKGHISERDFEPLVKDDPVIILAPGETILAHTEEFIGATDKATTMMKARSSWGRAFLSVCKDAGWGDVGYINRWTMEIQNNLPYSWTPVPVGQPIAQLVFFRVNPVAGEQYGQTGNYQQGADISELREKWTPEAMLPRLRRKTPVLYSR